MCYYTAHMAYKISAVGMFRTSTRRVISDGQYSFKQEDQTKAECLLTELEGYVIHDRLDYPQEVSGPYVNITISTEFIELNTNRKRSVEILFDLHKIFSKKFVPKDLYKSLWMALLELKAQELHEINSEILGEIDFIHQRCVVGKEWPECSLNIHAESELKARNEGRSRGKEHW